MGQTPDELKADIEGTRADMTATVDAIADRANPRNAARRQAGRVGQRVASARNAVMGTVSEATTSVTGATGAASDRAGSLAGTASGSLHATPNALRAQTQGNPIAAGIVTFGAGMLLASILPSNRAEQRTAAALADQASPMVDGAKRAASEVAAQVKSSQDAADQVKGTASDSRARPGPRIRCGRRGRSGDQGCRRRSARFGQGTSQPVNKLQP